MTKGLGSGGTYGATIWHLHLSLFDNRASPLSWVLGPNFTHVHEVLLPTFMMVMMEKYALRPKEDFTVRWSGIPEIELATGHTISFKSANKAEHLVGATISHGFRSEPGLYRGDLPFTKSDDRLRCGKATRLQWLNEGTPEGLIGHYPEHANFPVGVHPDPEKNYRRIKLHTSANRYNPVGYLEKTLARYAHDRNRQLSYTAGEFTNFLQGNAYWTFGARVICDDHVATPALPVTFTWDFNIGLAWVALQRFPFEAGGRRRHRECYVAESSGKSQDLDYAIAEFIVAFPVSLYRYTDIEIDGDASGHAGSHKHQATDYQRIATALRNYGYERVRIVAPASNPIVRNRLEVTARAMEYGYLVCRPELVNLIKSFTTTALKENSWSVEKPKGETWTHFGEAATYPVHRKYQNFDFEKPHATAPGGFNIAL